MDSTRTDGVSIKPTIHSGGCPGSDMEWETQGYEYGLETIAYSFHNHVQYGKKQRILTLDELAEGHEHVKLAAKTIKRNPFPRYPYVRNLLSRNWFQVKNAMMVCAIGKFMDGSRKLVSGGTGWAVQMAIDSKKPVYFFDQPTNSWYTFNFGTDEFVPTDHLPRLPEHFAGIGTREIEYNGKRAIGEVLKFNCTL